MSLDDLLYPSLVVPREMKKRVPKLVVLAPDDFDPKGRGGAALRERELKAKAAQRKENQRAYAKLKTDPEKHAARKAKVRAWWKANPERVAEYRRRYRATEAYRRYQRDWRRKNRPAPKGQPRGEGIASAKLTADQVRLMRARYAAGGIPIRVLAQEFGVSFTGAHKVVTRLTWRHVG